MYIHYICAAIEYAYNIVLRERSVYVRTLLRAKRAFWSVQWHGFFYIYIYIYFRPYVVP